jgi:hypothetical protein
VCPHSTESPYPLLNALPICFSSERTGNDCERDHAKHTRSRAGSYSAPKAGTTATLARFCFVWLVYLFVCVQVEAPVVDLVPGMRQLFTPIRVHATLMLRCSTVPRKGGIVRQSRSTLVLIG